MGTSTPPSLQLTLLLLWCNFHWSVIRRVLSRLRRFWPDCSSETSLQLLWSLRSVSAFNSYLQQYLFFGLVEVWHHLFWCWIQFKSLSILSKEYRSFVSQYKFPGVSKMIKKLMQLLFYRASAGVWSGTAISLMIKTSQFIKICPWPLGTGS